jgi:hypothetical protein
MLSQRNGDNDDFTRMRRFSHRHSFGPSLFSQTAKCFGPARIRYGYIVPECA